MAVIVVMVEAMKMDERAMDTLDSCSDDVLLLVPMLLLVVRVH